MNEIHNIDFNKTAFSQLAEMYSIPKMQIMAATNQTNPAIVKRMLGGTDIYVATLTNICSNLHLDLLSFFKYDNHTFKTNLENLYRLEKAGINVADLLNERGIDAYDPSVQGHTVGAICEAREDVDRRVEKQINIYNERNTNEPLSLNEVISKIDKMREQAYNHEKQALDKLRKEMQAEINSLYEEIGALKAKNKQLSEQAGYSSRLVADDTPVGEV